MWDVREWGGKEEEEREEEEERSSGSSSDWSSFAGARGFTLPLSASPFL